MWKEIDDWNKDPAHPTKIRAITPYRWTLNDDGTGRDFAIGNRTTLLGELTGAFAQKYAWTSAKTCGGMMGNCQDDAGCSGQGVCDWGAMNCQSTNACGANAACGAGELCRFGTLDCVPETRGPATIVFDPPAPSPGATVKIDVSAAQGYTNIGLSLEELGGSTISTNLLSITGNGPYHWIYEATLGGEGTYRATFRADPNANTIYAIGYANVGQPVVPGSTGSGGNAATGSGGATNGAGGATNGAGGNGGNGEGGDSGEGCGCALPGGPSNAEGIGLIVLAWLALASRRRFRSNSAP